MLLDVLADGNVPVFGVGKIHDIYNGRGVGAARHHEKQHRRHGRSLPTLSPSSQSGLIFANLVDFDMLYGHRKDVEGFARSLEEFDAMLGPFLTLLRPTDLLLMHCRPWLRHDPVNPTTDHSRQYVPIVAYTSVRCHGGDLGVRETLRRYGPNHRRKFRHGDPAWKQLFLQGPAVAEAKDKFRWNHKMQ